MATILYNNLPALRPSRAFNSMLSEVLRDSVQPAAKPSASFVPQADVLETAQGFELHLALPGVAKEDLKVDFQEGRLEISGERKAPATEGEGAPQLRRIETRYGTFSRTFRLPETVNVAAIDAQLADGILRVVLPFDSAKTTKQTIEVR
ncbi:Hsp20/alpha crystallin family protein [Hymenobacter lutimineralis]|uniref:Hsp20/alpha crystallin family protein n=1 Tax=Hymenobacter lutimineralis TaxID=2606448 RepID=A0A5D6V299_9BACT|nr:MULTISPECIES: Hsp20/alpha crystallin family protein [Hymenobacter]QIX61039.1 Hsp20/alpha crystallin family protein [Hymenobacter sp. BT18]TYZ09676.1 Hsp20/alpha crystallin family protein [Hymenobacter lutimineralis]